VTDSWADDEAPIEIPATRLGDGAARLEGEPPALLPANDALALRFRPGIHRSRARHVDLPNEQHERLA
jgi:hypothetical protein